MLDTDDTKELWRPLVGYDGVYEISNMGRVRSVGRTVLKKNGRSDFLKPKPIKTPPTKGYPRFNTRKNGETIQRWVHQEVMAAFVGPCPPGHEVCHKDGDPTNCRLSNLEYGTRAKNIADAKRHGTFRNGASHLTEEIVRAIADRHDDVARVLAAEFGVSMSTIAGIRNRRVWAHLDLPLRDSYIRRGEAHPSRRGKQSVPTPEE